ncbi:MAG: PIG-L family deacetylase [Anaerolineales bacterium]|nr:PIG-L family deacetylase [Anaerolineales bacterium]
MHYIYLSPHFDDAALSAGGLIHDLTRTGNTVEIWNFFCGLPPGGELSPFAQELHFEWGTTSAEETIRIRRAEDEKAASIMGAKTTCFDFLDCIYRRGAEGDWLYADVYLPPHEADADLPARIAESISARLTRDDVLICQLSVGSHVDHVIVRQAAELLDRPLLYAIDIPYLFKYPDELALKSAGMKEKLYSISEAGLRSWQDAAAAYVSQLSTLLEPGQDLRDMLQSYWAEQSGIRLWLFG